ncbi:hypothetical protein ACEWY4_017363 [Coilia grayii]|uniref:Neurotransmitter-gated ion-channel ligand-binding domain-containing protein n=1 Tax=Coilia grayii TaxID=363190 RepID=A0ABD1JHP9_9TELE
MLLSTVRDTGTLPCGAVLLWVTHLTTCFTDIPCGTADASTDPASPTLTQWLSSILDSEAAQLRPVRDWQRSVSVRVDLNIRSVLDVDEKSERLLLYVLYTQAWLNEFLRWDPGQFGGVQQVTLPADKLWRPDLILYEIAGLEDYDRSTQLSVTHNGWVEQYQPRLLETSCPLNLFHFPLDTHTCNLTFMSQTHTVGEMELYWGPGMSDGWEDTSFSRGEWELIAISAITSHPQQRTHGHPTLRAQWELIAISAITSHPQQRTHDHPTLRAQVTVRRRPLLYVVMLLLPTALLMLLDLLSFLIPAYLKQRLSVTATIFTGHFLFLIAVFTLFPPFTTKLPLIEVYLFGSLGLLGCSAMETAVVFQIANGRSEWFMKNIFPSLSLLSGRSQSETLLTDSDRQQTAGGAVEPNEALGLARSLLSDLARIGQDLRSMRQEQSRLGTCREVGCSVDRGYLYLHCLVLMVGGAALLAQWNKQA